MTAKDDELVEAARKARRNAYAPYSKYRVGAAVLDDTGRVHTGCNVENGAYPLGSCAEVNAIGAMVAAGGRRIVAIVAVGGRDDRQACTPCGGCRQAIREFADDRTRVLLIDEAGAIRSCGIADLLPGAFSMNAPGC